MSRSQAEDSSIGSVGAVLRRRRGAILLATLLGALTGVAIAVLSPAVYRGHVRVEIRRAPSDTRGGTPSFQSEQVSMYTAAERITSRALLNRLADEFRGRGWIEGDTPAGERRGSLMAWAVGVESSIAQRLGLPAVPRVVDPEGEVDWLETVVSIQPVRDTRLVDILVDHTDPIAARTMAGRVGALFSDLVATDESPDTAGVTIALPPAAEGGDGPRIPQPVDRSTLQARIHELNAALSDLTRDRLQVRGEMLDAATKVERLRRAARDTALDLATLPADVSLAGLRHELVDAQARLDQALQTLGPRHPRIVELERQVEAIRAGARREVRRVLADQESEEGALAGRERALGEELDRTEGSLRQAMALDRPDSPLPEVAAVGTGVPAVRRPTVEIVDGPAVDPLPIRPHRALDVAVCALAGALVGCAIVLLRFGDGRVLRTPADVEAALELPVLGVIPRRPRLAAEGSATWR